jgi:hypothetical protein
LHGDLRERKFLSACEPKVRSKAVVSAAVSPLRIAFAALWIALQGTLIATSGARADGAFGFRMFSESSTIEYSLRREVKTPLGPVVIVPAPDGEWVAKDGSGVPRRIAWGDRVKRPELDVFDATFHASYSARAQLARLEMALDDVASHIPEDAETRRLLLTVTIRRNGRDPEVFHYASRQRL